MLPNLPLLLASSLLLLPALVSSHGALYVPAPRNSIDSNPGGSRTVLPRPSPLAPVGRGPFFEFMKFRFF